MHHSRQKSTVPEYGCTGCRKRLIGAGACVACRFRQDQKKSCEVRFADQIAQQRIEKILYEAVDDC